MNRRGTRPDVARILKGLKDFQRRSVDRVFRRMYTDPEPTTRFLLADEVGLGKTLVCRGLLAKAIDHLWDTVDRIDVLYICSNADIARQNIQRLNLEEGSEFEHAARITLLPISIADLESNKVNFISITPKTSLDLKSSMGRARERALLYWMLHDAWGIKGKGAKGVLRGYTKHARFRDRVDSFDTDRIDEGLSAGFTEALQCEAARAQTSGALSLRERFEALMPAFSTINDGNISLEDWHARATLLGEIRALLAESCLAALEPDIVILDEFQRFKTLLDGTDPAATLANQIFTFDNVRVLLVSATPYRMFTLADEAHDDEDHHADFVQTLRFLYRSGPQTERVAELLSEYRQQLFALGIGGGERLEELNTELESLLTSVMLRTERLAASADRNGMLVQVDPPEPGLTASDVEAWLALQGVARALEKGSTLEYWKSASYLLNFMDGYKLKEALVRAADGDEPDEDLLAALRSAPGLLLPWKNVQRYAALDPGNARLRALLADTIARGLWKLLWIPPSLPYYEPGGPFADAGLRSMTKRLVFSAWRVVPKTIAAFLSYEAERHALKRHEPEATQDSDAAWRKRRLLRFARAGDELSGMTVLGILYPSVVLAELADPLVLFLERGALPSHEAHAWARERIAPRLASLLASARPSDRVDQRWYWAAPLLLDFDDRVHGPATRAWLERQEAAQCWAGEDTEAEDDSPEDRSGWEAHVDAAWELATEERDLGRPPEDLLDVLATMALGAPGVLALRTLARQSRTPTAELELQAAVTLRDAAGVVAFSLRRQFNAPDVAALLRGLGGEAPYWQQVAEYGLHGNLQSALDEYAHQLCEGLGLEDAEPAEVFAGLAKDMAYALALGTARLYVDEIRVGRAGFKLRRRSMRARFAMRLAADDGDESSAATFQDQIRAAFNSPFRPFVLATTSVGQEGLDFHPYSHAVVHWNLPTNPVDLEQREGRVHRYKGHAVRKNLAARHGADLARVSFRDPWTKLFELAQAGRDDGLSDLQPYWIYPGEARIERHVPILPLSREVNLLTALRRSLVVYRMAFGQPRQEELIEYLLERLGEEDMAILLETLRVDLSPPEIAEGPAIDAPRGPVSSSQRGGTLEQR